MLARDPEGETRFAAIQEEIPRALYAHFHLDTDQFDTFMVLMEGRPRLKWAGVQRHRLDWFWRRETCFVPSAAQRRRLLTNAGALT